MYTNQCTKCNKVFETKNPKRIVCPECLYLNKASEGSYDSLVGSEGGQRQTSFGGGPRQGGGGYSPRPQQGGGGYGPPRQGGGGYGPRPQQGGGGYGPPRQGGGYGGPRQGGGGYGPRPQQGGGGYGPPRQGGGYGGPRPMGGRPRPGGGRPMGGRPPGPPKKLLFPREMMMEIEKRYKELLPLPNPDCYVKIAEALNVPVEENIKVFFAINVIRQKMRLPKLEVPKRPLAVSVDQLEAVKTLYVPYLPMPPIGIHKIIAKQLRMDEWRVHVAIGLVRKQEGMERWNEGREDLPEKMRTELEELRKRQAEAKEKEAAEAEKSPKKEKAKKAAPANDSEPAAVTEESPKAPVVEA